MCWSGRSLLGCNGAFYGRVPKVVQGCVSRVSVCFKSKKLGSLSVKDPRQVSLTLFSKWSWKINPRYEGL